MQCRRCGAPLPEGTNICLQCGHGLVEKKIERKRKIWPKELILTERLQNTQNVILFLG